MSDHSEHHEVEKEGTFFEESTVAVGTIYVILALAGLLALILL